METTHIHDIYHKKFTPTQVAISVNMPAAEAETLMSYQGIKYNNIQNEITNIYRNWTWIEKKQVG